MILRIAVLVCLMSAAVLSRLVEHPPNFTPILAVALFGAAHFRSRIASLSVPLAVMLLSDVAIEVATKQHWFNGWLAQGSGFYAGMWVVYASIAAVWAIGLILRKELSFRSVVGTSLLGSLVFFLITNFAWWAGYNEYPHTLAGLVQSYTLAIPFFKWTVLSTLLYAAILFGGFAFAQSRLPALRFVAHDANRAEC